MSGETNDGFDEQETVSPEGGATEESNGRSVTLQAPSSVWTKRELEAYLIGISHALGRPPIRSDVPPFILDQIKREWGKWLYALESTGLRTPSKDTLEKREERKESLVQRRTERRARRKR